MAGNRRERAAPRGRGVEEEGLNARRRSKERERASMSVKATVLDDDARDELL